MLEPLIWMFKTKDFGKRFIQLFFTNVLTMLLFVLILLNIFFNINVDFQSIPVLMLAAIIVFIVGSFIIQGYFWELAGNVISRDWDISASSVYSGKINEKYIIKLPEFKPLRLCWRGFASIVATILMFLPFALLVISTSCTNVFIMPIECIEQYNSLYKICYDILYFMFLLALPALLWNYAKQNSIFAVWSVQKFVYLLDSYTAKYFINSIYFIIFYAINCVVLFAVHYGMLILGFTTESYIPQIVAGLFASFLYLYNLHVYAYLLGTITPVTEG